MNRLFVAMGASIALGFGATTGALAHQLNVFASTDCETVRVEARFSSGRAPVRGEVRFFNGDSTLVSTADLGEDGTLSVPLTTLDASTGLKIEVDTGDHDDYWILTPQDIARQCPS